MQSKVKLAADGSTKGLWKENNFQKSEITMEVGGWVQVSLRIFVVENSPKPVLIFWSSIPCVFIYMYIAKKLLVIMISVFCPCCCSDGFPKKSLDGGW